MFPNWVLVGGSIASSSPTGCRVGQILYPVTPNWSSFIAIIVVTVIITIVAHIKDNAISGRNSFDAPIGEAMDR